MCLITYWQRKTGSVQPASVSWAAPEPVSPAAVWSTFISPRTTGREVLGSTGGSHRFQADKGCYGREFSDFQNIKMLSFYCVLFDDHCLVSGLRRPFWLHQHSGDDFPDSQPGPGEKTTRGVSVGCGSRVTGGCEKHLAWWVGAVVVRSHWACLLALDLADGLFKTRRLWSFPGSPVQESRWIPCRRTTITHTAQRSVEVFFSHLQNTVFWSE